MVQSDDIPSRCKEYYEGLLTCENESERRPLKHDDGAEVTLYFPYQSE